MVRRERTNTPLQALLMLNEPQFVEAARALAERTLREGGSTSEDRLTYIHRVVLARPPEAKDLAELTAALNDLTTHYTQDPAAAKQLLATGETRSDPRTDPSILAAWTMIANVILNWVNRRQAARANCPCDSAVHSSHVIIRSPSRA